MLASAHFGVARTKQDDWFDTILDVDTELFVDPFLIFDCRANNIVIDPETDLGRGPVDFKFSNGYLNRAHLEVKKLHNGKFWNGLDLQLPAYLSSDEVDKGWFLVIRYRDGKKWDQRSAALPGRIRLASDKGVTLRAREPRPRAKPNSPLCLYSQEFAAQRESVSRQILEKLP